MRLAWKRELKYFENQEGLSELIGKGSG